jgi:ribosomal protein S18 acetylase RimI-like enzyme
MVHAGREPASAEDKAAAVLRQEKPSDADFLAAVFRANALDLYGAAGPALEPMIPLQYRSQVQTYAMAYPDALSEIVLSSDQPAGRLLTHRNAESIHVVDIAILPGWRQKGLARAALGVVQQRAAAAGLAVTAQIIVTNTASLALFGSLGFSISPPDGGAQVMCRWMP